MKCGVCSATSVAAGQVRERETPLRSGKTPWGGRSQGGKTEDRLRDLQTAVKHLEALGEILSHALTCI